MRALRTVRLRLCALTADELAEVNAASNGPAASVLSSGAAAWMERMAANADPRVGGGWSFRHAVTRKLIGLCLYFSPDGVSAEVSYIVSPTYRGRGYCSEAMERILAELFEEVGFARLYADVALDNRPSLRVLAKLAFAPGTEDAEPVHVGLDRRPAVRHHRNAVGRVREAPEPQAALQGGLTSP